MCEQVGNRSWNPEIERMQREPGCQYHEPEDEDEPCDVCGYDPCRCDGIDAVADGIEKQGAKIEGSKS